MKHLKTIFSVLALFAAFSCTKSQTESSGYVAFDLSSDQEIADKTKSQVSNFTALPSAGDFILTIKDASSAEVWEGKLSEWDPKTPLVAGNYTVEAVYGGDEEGFDKPFFAGSQTFSINGGETVPVPINVILSNTVIKINCSEYFKKYFVDYEFKLTRDGQDVVTFTKDETRAAFIDGYKITLEYELTNEAGTSFTNKTDYTQLESATAYTVNFDVPEVGGSTIKISFNDTVETVELGDYELND